MPTVWTKGPCDVLLANFEAWFKNYERGEVAATRPYLNHGYQKVDLPVQFAHSVPFSLLSLEHLVRILEAEAPESKTTEDFRKIYGICRHPGQLARHSKMVRSHGGGMLTISMILEKAEIGTVLEILRAVKEGRPVGSAGNRLLEEKASVGKGLWE